MSLRTESIPDLPEGTARVARAAFPKVNLYLKKGRNGNNLLKKY